MKAHKIAHAVFTLFSRHLHSIKVNAASSYGAALRNFATTASHQAFFSRSSRHWHGPTAQDYRTPQIPGSGNKIGRFLVIEHMRLLDCLAQLSHRDSFEIGEKGFARLAYEGSGAPKDMSSEAAFLRSPPRPLWVRLPRRLWSPRRARSNGDKLGSTSPGKSFLPNSENRLLNAWLATHASVVEAWPTDQKTMETVLENKKLADKLCPSN